MIELRAGDTVRVERDETRYPPKGSWRQYSGRTGTVVEVNGHKLPHLTEYGVAFGWTAPRRDRPEQFQRATTDVAWFQRHELARTTCTAPEIDVEPQTAPEPPQVPETAWARALGYKP
jgi:hypothetical protein